MGFKARLNVGRQFRELNMENIRIGTLISVLEIFDTNYIGIRALQEMMNRKRNICKTSHPL